MLEDYPALIIRAGRRIKAALSQQMFDVINGFCLFDCFHKKIGA
jgi:hypothetical protein